jgi:glutamate-1-semialdehyde 2,1-aminomutase
MEIGQKMTAAISDVLRGQNKHRGICQGVTSMFQIFFTDAEEITDYRDFCSHVDRTKYRDFALRLMDRGIYMTPGSTLHSLPSILHDEADIAHTAQIIAEVLEAWD